MSTILIAPGLYDSAPAHWQSWLAARLGDSVRVEQEDWNTPYLPAWAGQVRRRIAQANGHVWLIAHSFACLASVVAAVDFRDKLAGLMLVAPADPDKFDIASYLPVQRLGIPCVVVASTNDPWMRLTKAAYWADVWGARFINAGAVGHLNVESGFGPWPDGLEIFEQLRATQATLPLGALEPEPPVAVRRRRDQSTALQKRLAANWHAFVYGSEASS
jgi:uncharacterized protein